MRTSKCRGPCPSCGGSGTKPKRRLPPGGPRTARRRTPPAWMGWPAPSRTGPTTEAAGAEAAAWASPDPSEKAIAGTPVGSPPARSRCSPTAGISSFRGSASSRPTSPQGSWPVALNRVLPESSPPPSAARLTAGSSPSPSRCNGISQPATARRAWSEWTSVSATWPCCPLVWWFPIPMRSNGLCARCGGSTGNFIAASWALAVAARPDGGSRGSMPEPGWSEIATWPVPWPMPAWPDCAASSATRPTGMVAGSSSPTPSIPRPRRARPVAG